jgi:NAD(P)-dependent dehydrogenase (short-subunit alcohol dehydrogenase family)
MQDLSLFSLEGRKALVTGGGQGIGRACAIALAMGGADVAIIGRRKEVGEKAVAAVRELGRESFFVQCDVSQESEVEAMVQSVVQRFGRLDIGVNNAGSYIPGDDEAQPKREWDEVIGVNLTGTWLCARAEMRQMIRQKPCEGKIINIASIAAKIACSNGSYDASKAAVVHLTKTLALWWGRYNINVNSISPGYVVGGFGQGRPLEMRERLRKYTPLGHVQRPEDLYGPVLFLASNASNYVTGQDMIVDGGNTLSSWIAPLERTIPPRVDPEGEAVELKRDLRARGVRHDANGIVIENT